jgi:uncharacterized protein (DUF2141 family)
VRGLFPYLILATTSILAFSCAVKESPPGGPEDMEPPGIVTVDPPPGSINIPLDSRFTVTFSKPMDRTVTENSVFLSPVFWDFPRMEWSGKRLTVYPPENLMPGRTYVLTVGADCEGYHHNKIGSSHSFAFSTGPEIDSGSIAGAVYSIERRSRNYDIWAYAVTDTPGMEFLSEIPDYATQIDSLGAFEINNVSPGHYVVVAIDDTNDDLFWDPTSESIGLPPFILSISGNELVKGLILRPDRRDTSLAYISRARPIDNRKLEVEFSQPVSDQLMLDKSSYLIKSMEGPDTVEVLGDYIGMQDILVLETGLQQPRTQYRLYANDLTSIWGNNFDTTGARFEGSEIEDSLGPALVSVFPQDRSRDVYQDSVIELTFSERINPLGFSEAVIVVVDSVDTLPFAPSWIAPNKVRLRFGAGLPRESMIEVRVTDGAVFDAVGNPLTDTAAVFSFVLPPADTVGTVTASLDTVEAATIIGVLTSMERSDRTYESVSDDSGNLSFENVLPGAYWFEYFEDADGDGKWSSGVIRPFKPAERFGFLADSVSVRSRWTTSIGEVQLPDSAGEKD